ncbi:MAG: ABC transporter substrate-binding protein [Acidimicrobiales bacterium]
MDVYFDYVNANGGIGGRRIEMITKDDQYLAAETIEKVDELIQVDNPFAISTLGTPGTLAVYDSVNTQCIPHPFVQTGHPAWGDPVNHPFTIGLQMTYTAEAGLWGDWIRENMAGQLPVRVSAIVMDNDFGLAYESGFENWIASNPGVVSEFVPVRHDPAAPELSGPVATAAAANPDVFISMTAGNPCLLAIQSAANQGIGESVVKFTPSVCAQVNAFVGPAGDAADGWRIVNGGQKASNDPAYANEAFIAFMNQQLAAAGYDPDIALYGTGFGLFAWTYVEALRIADQLDGGLTRSNLVLAMRSLNLVHPMLADGIRLTTFGLDDSYPIEGSEYATFNAVSQTWVVESVADLNGETPNCSWGASGC